ncbi:serine palmitoyltransferase small subunit A [Bufo bufo]|uniref:serine palmitoyltransferase small subunit A n=2 Tax=Bufo TaxID=8383 RepID=UPI001ABE5AFF|nr:serine palmitoyltransferase small subunit A [Bufo bufo]
MFVVTEKHVRPLVTQHTLLTNGRAAPCTRITSCRLAPPRALADRGSRDQERAVASYVTGSGDHYVTARKEAVRLGRQVESSVFRCYPRMKVSCEAGAQGSLGRAWKQMSWLYYQYLLVTALYMLEPWERTIFNSMLVSIIGMALYTGYIFMPQHILAILHYFEIVQ